MNEGGCGPDGRFYVGSMSYQSVEGGGALYRLDPDLEVHTMIPGLTIPNGLQWSADGSTVFHGDTGVDLISAYDFDADEGRFVDKRPFVDFAGESVGSPDGFAIDAEGGLWVGMWGGNAVHRYDASGQLTEVISVAATNVTSCAFAGEGSSTLYISTSLQGVDPDDEPGAGAIHVATVGAKGARVHRFGG